jgi:predicted molibdopterin-dependent oxidoreductase YjgC
MKLVVIDPRRTDTAEAADLHLPCCPAPTSPSTTPCSTSCCGKAG